MRSISVAFAWLPLTVRHATKCRRLLLLLLGAVGWGGADLLRSCRDRQAAQAAAATSQRPAAVAAAASSIVESKGRHASADHGGRGQVLLRLAELPELLLLLLLLLLLKGGAVLAAPHQLLQPGAARVQRSVRELLHRTQPSRNLLRCSHGSCVLLLLLLLARGQLHAAAKVATAARELQARPAVGKARAAAKAPICLQLVLLQLVLCWCQAALKISAGTAGMQDVLLLLLLLLLLGKASYQAAAGQRGQLHAAKAGHV